MILGIFGPGALGLSLAAWSAECGLDVRLMGRDETHAARGLSEIERRWKVAVQRGRMSAQDHGAASKRLRACELSPDSLADLDVFFEALPEDLAIKMAAWKNIASLLPDQTLRLTGSSSLPIADLDRETALENRLLGFHLFMPVPRMDIVELVSTERSRPNEISKAKMLAQRIHKQVAQVRDQPGYAASRMALAQGLEAMRLLESGVASAEDLDALMVKGYGHPVGPLELSDRVGLDLRLRIAEGLFKASHDPRFAAPVILRDHVERGHTGRKAGQGFFRWTFEGRKA
jgi:3-hydroxybutyryl-CoA dehydrogenase